LNKKEINRHLIKRNVCDEAQVKI